MTNHINIEEEFNSFVSSVSGRQVSELVGNSPSFSNADYIFESDQIVAELKCLEDNKLNDKNISNKLTKLYLRWRSEGHNISLTHNGWRGSINGLTKEQSLQVLKVYAKPIRKRIIKANKQIKETKKALGCENYKGILLIANDGNMALDIEHVHAIINYILGKSYSGINAVVFFTVNQRAKADFTDAEVAFWGSFNRPGFESISEEFFRRLSSGWRSHISKSLGYTPKVMYLPDESKLAGITNINKT